MRTNRPLTEKQHNILRFVCECCAHGVPPTIREIGLKFGLSSTNAVADALHAIEVKGFITREGGGKARAIQPTMKALEFGFAPPRYLLLEALYLAVREWHLRPATSLAAMRDAVEALMAHDKKGRAA